VGTNAHMKKYKKLGKTYTQSVQKVKSKNKNKNKNKNKKGNLLLLLLELSFIHCFVSIVNKLFILWGWMCYLVGMILWNKNELICMKFNYTI